MEAKKVIEIYELLHHHNIEIIIDGGWAVDALLEQETRKHDDLDIAVNHKEIPKLRNVMSKHGFTDFERPDTKDYNFVLADSTGSKIDIHSFLFDDFGNCIYGIAYQKDCFSGIGKINGVEVKCIAPQWLVKFHTGYDVDETDYHDIKRICAKFGFPIPKDYDKFINIIKKK